MITQQLRSKLLKAFLHWESDCGLWPVGVWGLLAASVWDGAQTGRGGGGRGRVTVPNIKPVTKAYHSNRGNYPFINSSLDLFNTPTYVTE